MASDYRALAVISGCLVLAGTARAEVNYEEYDPVTYYEVWRGELDDLGTASCFQSTQGQWSRWLTSPSFLDDTAVPATVYYYWGRAVTAKTRTATFSELGWVTDDFSGTFSMTCPIQTQEGTELPIRIMSEITDNNWGGPPLRSWTVHYDIGEYDFDFDGWFLQAQIGWTSSPPNDPTHVYDFTDYYDIADMETTTGLTDWHSPAEVYARVQVKDTLAVPLTHMEVSFLDGDHYQVVPFTTPLAAAPVVIAQGTTDGVVLSWDPTPNDTTQFSTAVMGIRPLAPPDNVQATDGTYSDKIVVTWDGEPGYYYAVYVNNVDDSSSAMMTRSWSTETNLENTTAAENTIWYFWTKAATSQLGDNQSEFSQTETGWRGVDCNDNETPDPDDPDADGDGIPDDCDDCPDTVPNSPVDDNGCPPVIIGDFDRDGDVDGTDYDHFAVCSSGPEIPQNDQACASAKLDDDEDVDQSDFGVFQRCISGENIPADPSCASFDVDDVVINQATFLLGAATCPHVCQPQSCEGPSWEQTFDLPFVPQSDAYLVLEAAEVSQLYNELHINDQFIGYVPQTDPTCTFYEKSVPIPFGILVAGQNTLRIDAHLKPDGYENTLYREITVAWASSPEMVLISADEFQMGDQSIPYDGDTDEQPVHPVYVDTFYMDRYEVTNDQYKDALNWAYGQGGLITVSDGVVYKYNSGTSYPYCDTNSADSDSCIVWNGSTFTVESGRSDQPVVEVSWYGSVAHANWRSAMEGRPLGYDLSTWNCNWNSGYRLPTEAEWEKAARGDLVAQRFPWGDHIINHDYANYRANGSEYSYDTSPYTSNTYHPDFDDDDYPYTSPVGYFAPNGYGLYDMAGNVWEWCNDWYLSTYYSTPEASQPNPRGPTTAQEYRVLRGGSWGSNADDCRVAERFYNGLDGTPNRRNHFSGFRLVLGSR